MTKNRRSKGQDGSPPSEAKSAPRKAPRRRREIFGGSSRNNPKKRKSSDNDEHHRVHGDRRGVFADGIFYGMASWLWRTTTNALNWSTRGIVGGNEDRKAGRGDEAIGGTNVSGITMAAPTLVLGMTVAAAILILSSNKKRANRVQSEAAIVHEERKDTQARQGHHDSGEAIDKGDDDRPVHDPPAPRHIATSVPSDPRLPSLRHKTKTKEWTSATGDSQSGERRVSLYDVLTGDAPLPPRIARTSTVSGAGTTATTTRGGNGTLPLGGSRRASIFDRIADVVFNEEHKDDNPVDAVVVRAQLADKFSVTFREGAMGMTLTMDPGSRNALVGKIVPQGQAYRAGVYTDDLVIGVGEHNVSSYGTVLAFMNIMGRPIDLHFRRADSSHGQMERGGGIKNDNDEAFVCRNRSSGGKPASISEKDAFDLGAGGSAALPQGRSGMMQKLAATGGSREGSMGESVPRKVKMTIGQGGSKAPLSPISPRSAKRVSGLGALGQEVASSDSSFSVKMERGVVVTKYGKKGAAAQRVLFLDGESMALAWRDLDSRSPGHRRAPSLTNLLKGQRGALSLTHLIEVIAGDESDPDRPSAKGSPILREHCDETLLERSFALQFKERSLEMTCDSQAEMRQLVTGFRDLQTEYGP